MGNRNILCGAATVEVDLMRYDELLHKEAELECILHLIARGIDLTYILREFVQMNIPPKMSEDDKK